MKKDATELHQVAPTTTLTDKISQILRNAITSGTLCHGRLLLETHVGSLLGTTRNPVRFALAQLETERLISRLPKRGFVVGPASSTLDRAPLTSTDLGLKDGAQGLKKDRASANIYDSVESALIHCSLFGLVQINEKEMATYYGVSRTVAHDVLMLAHDNGIVLKDERSRWVTVPLNVQRVTDLYELRYRLEPLALAKAASFVPANKLKKIAQKLESALARYPRISGKILDELERELHVDCLSFCPNAELVEALKRTRCILIFGKHILGREISYPTEEPFMKEHLAIVQAMIQGDVTAVERMCVKHLRVAQPKLEERIKHVASMRKPIQWPFANLLRHAGD